MASVTKKIPGLFIGAGLVAGLVWLATRPGLWKAFNAVGDGDLKTAIDAIFPPKPSAPPKPLSDEEIGEKLREEWEKVAGPRPDSGEPFVPKDPPNWRDSL